ncbi:hypothetical protein E1301_Tti002521 [Triplophysa tibetana]|uniref:Uncharacterized protein n=1 Tax=Triplophysa tibetana TaxID=1572043 RepID=A0A5A9NC11_9TELE|nr:hypothetical protein E1301_Tti002521 [Triplophysa tibetana]
MDRSAEVLCSDHHGDGSLPPGLPQGAMEAGCHLNPNQDQGGDETIGNYRTGKKLLQDRTPTINQQKSDPRAPSYIDTDSVRCERGCLSEFGCGGALYPVGGLGSHVSTCTILLTKLPGLTGEQERRGGTEPLQMFPITGPRGRATLRSNTCSCENRCNPAKNKQSNAANDRKNSVYCVRTAFLAAKCHASISAGLYDHTISVRHHFLLLNCIQLRSE